MGRVVWPRNVSVTIVNDEYIKSSRAFLALLASSSAAGFADHDLRSRVIGIADGIAHRTSSSFLASCSPMSSLAIVPRL